MCATDDGSAGEAGFVTAALERRLAAGRRYARALACGPNPMLRALARLARERGTRAPSCRSRSRWRAASGCASVCVVELADGRLVPSCKEGPVFPAARLAARWSA